MIQNIFKKFLEIMMRNRQTGHTSLLEKIAEEHDVCIIVDNEEMGL